MVHKYVNFLKHGKVIGLPTDTVYGLAADARRDQAVAEIYALKDRPAFNPLIIHVENLAKAKLYGSFNDDAIKLAHYFWVPSATTSALSIVVPYTSGVSKLALAGLNTIALRVPNHPLALQVLKEFDGPLAAPSANPSNYLSPTTAQHVKDAFPNLPVLDGGPCQIGIESTIVSCMDNDVYLLRAGVVTKEEIEAVLGKTIQIKKHDEAINAPGQLKRHYAPKTPLVMDVTEPEEGDAYIGFGMYCHPHESEDPLFQGDDGSILNLSPTGNLKEATANLFRYLHEADLQQVKRIAVAPIPNVGIGVAINERLTKAQHSPAQSRINL